MDKTAIVFLADGFEEVEALTVVDYLRRAGVTVKLVAVPSPTMKKDNVVESSHKVKVFSDLTFKEFKKEFATTLPDLTYAPGGMPGSINLSNNQDVLDFFNKCSDNGKYVCAICAAPALVLSKTHVLVGKKWTCFPGMQESANKEGIKGSTHIDTEPFVTDGNLITGRGAGAAEQFAMECVRLLCGQEVMQKIKVKSVQR